MEWFLSPLTITLAIIQVIGTEGGARILNYMSDLRTCAEIL
jgi:hypothetical protein